MYDGERSDPSKFVYPEAGHRNQAHGCDPEITERPVRGCPLWCGDLNGPSAHRDESDNSSSPLEPLTKEDPVEAASQREIEAIVRAALAVLDPADAEIVRAIYINAEPVTEIARRHGRCTSSIRRRARKALAQMREAA